MPFRAYREFMRRRLLARLREAKSELQAAIEHGDAAQTEAAEKLIWQIEESLEKLDDPRETQ